MNSPQQPPRGGGARIIAGRYRLRAVLGSGAMGTVWSAYDEFLHRPVAVKEVRVPPGLPPAQAGELRERTLREARAIAVLSHPNVITLHDVVRENGEPFVVMELLPSRSLAELLNKVGKLSVPQAVAVGDAMAAALEAAHNAGITHRDVKPGNVLVAADGRIKLTDFGIARNVSEPTMTRTGMMLGSPAYIAPEVASGGPVTPAADLWGLGATLFAATEGAPAYDVRGDPLETLSTVVHGPVPKPSPGPLAELIEALMVKDAQERIPAYEVRRRLHPMLGAPRATLFEPAWFRSPPVDPDDSMEATDTTSAITEPPPPPSPEKAGDSPKLAADPGPLPFRREPPPPPRAKPKPKRRGRRPLTTVALAVLAAVLFFAASAAGFALTRTIGAQPLTPPPRPPSPPAATAPPGPTPLAQATGDATSLKGAKGGLFTIQVPPDWARFVTQVPSSGSAPASTLIQYVSPDGAQTVGIQRFPDFYSSSSLDEYQASLRQAWSQGDFVLAEPLPANASSGQLVYRTTERAGRSSAPPREQPSVQTRTTFAKAVRNGNSLWVISVTVPTEQENTGRTDLFDRIAPTFSPTG